MPPRFRDSALKPIFPRELKGAGVFSHDPLGRPRGRKVDSIPKRCAIRRTQPSSPKGRPRWTLTRSASNSDAVCGRLTLLVQSAGRSIGQSLSQEANKESVCTRRHKLDHRQSSARSASRARKALRSTYRATVKKCSSVCTGNDLKRP